MKANVRAIVWGQLPDDQAAALSDAAIENQAHESAGVALARETPDAIEVSTFVFSLERLVNGVPQQGYCITAAVRVQRDTFGLNDRLALTEQVPHSLEVALGDLFSPVFVEDRGFDLEQPSMIEARGPGERRG